MLRRVRESYRLGLLLAAVTFVAYIPALRGGFVWDDAIYVRDNPIIKASDGLRRIWCTTEFTDYYALSNTSFWLEWRLWGNNPVGYHVTNVLLHVLNALLIWQLLRQLKIPGAYAAALVFALHPVNVMSVAWISERKNVLSLFFALLTVLAFLRWDETRERRWHVWAVVAFALALLSKTAVVMLPVVLLLLSWWRRRQLTRHDFVATIPFFVLSMVMGLVTILFERQHGITGYIVRDDSFVARLAGAGWAVWFYIWKTLWPTNLIVIYPRWEIEVGQLIQWLPLVVLALCLRQAWKDRRTWGQGTLFALGCLVILLFPVLGLFDVAFMAYSFVADHWLYPAIIAIIALVCAVVRWRPVMALLCVALGVMTWKQTQVWHDEERLWTDTLAKNPGAWMAHNNLGNILHAHDHDGEAVEHYRETIRLKPDYGNAHYNLGIVYYEYSEFDHAAGQFAEAARLKPESAEARNNLGAALVGLGRTNDAIAQFEIAATLAPQWNDPRNNLSRLR